MYINVNENILENVQNITAKLEKLPEQALWYTSGYAEGALIKKEAQARVQTTHK